MNNIDDFLDLLDRPIAFNPVFKRITGSTVAALFLSHIAKQDGWFSKTREEIEEETGLTRCEQDTARKVLRHLGILDEKKEGIPCRLFFRLNTVILKELLSTNKFSENEQTF